MEEISDDQLMRYARHVVLEEVGEEGQIKLLQSKVLVVGAGGLGSPVLMYLAAAGVGTLGVVDDDVVDITYLCFFTRFHGCKHVLSRFFHALVIFFFIKPSLSFKPIGHSGNWVFGAPFIFFVS